MENACQFLFDTLTTSPSTALITLSAANSSRSDPFSLSEVIDFLPDKRHPELVSLVAAALAPSVAYFCTENPLINRDHEMALNLGTEIVRSLVLSRKSPPFTSLRQILYDLHDVLLRLPSISAQQTIVDTCEWLWSSGDPQRERVIPQTLIFLLLKSFGDETLVVCDEDGAELLHRGTSKAIQRVFAIRRAFNTIIFGPSDSGEGTITTLLLRCATTPTYVKHVDGRKFIAFLLSIEDIRHDVLDTIVHQLASVRSSMASLYGHIILQAWRANRADWLADRLVHVAEKAIRAAHDPFASNLRIVLSSFHLNKRLNGIDQLLHRIYSPTLFGNLMVANVRVRSNAITILTEAFPIHDPGATCEEIDKTVTFQCTKMLELLIDPAPSVRRAAIEGVCRALGMYWELVPTLPAKKMIDLIVTKLAFDASSAIVRFACFEGLTFLMENHLSYPILSVVLRELRPLINDTSEKVRLGVVALLLKVKEKRLPQMRYFDIVRVDDLICRIPFERPAVAAKIMKLIVDSYFPVNKSGKTKQEMENVQVKACLSLLQTSEDAARYFYRHLNLYVAPGPICDFALRLSGLALELSTSSKPSKAQGRPLKPGGNVEGHRRTRARTRGDNTENEDPNYNLCKKSDDARGTETEKEQDGAVCKENLLSIVADLFASIEPSLRKEENQEIRDYVDDIFCGNSLKPLLSERTNSIRSRGACWRIASCITPSRIKSVIVYWREEMDSVVDWPWEVEENSCFYQELLSSMILCALRWNMIQTLLAIVSRWAECACSRNPVPKLGLKSAKRIKGAKPVSDKNKHKKKGGPATSEWQINYGNPLCARGRSLCALKAVGTALVGEGCDDGLCREFEWVLSSCRGSGEDDGAEPPPERLISCIRKGSLGAIDYLFESAEGDAKNCLTEFATALGAVSTALKASFSFSLFRERQGILLDLRETMEWLAGTDLWVNLGRIDRFFGCSLLGVCLGPIVDAVSLQRFEDRDLVLLQKVSTHASENLKSQNLSSIDRAALEFLRLAFVLDEHAAYLEDTEETSTNPLTKASLRSSAMAILANALDLLADAQAEEGQELGTAYNPSSLQNLIMRGLSLMGEASDCLEIKKLLGRAIVSQFCNENNESFLASTICNAVRALVTDSGNGGYDKAMSTFRFLWESVVLIEDASQNDLNKALLAFTKGIAKSTIQFHTNRGSGSSAAKEFFTSAESLFNGKFDTEDGDICDEISRVKAVMSAVQRLEDDDVTAPPTQS